MTSYCADFEVRLVSGYFSLLCHGCVWVLIGEVVSEVKQFWLTLECFSFGIIYSNGLSLFTPSPPLLWRKFGERKFPAVRCESELWLFCITKGDHSTYYPTATKLKAH